MSIKLSIIIPTLNEEQCLPVLLESIKKQNFSHYEIIVADAGSQDKTVEIAKKHKVLVVEGGLPAKGKNKGAKSAKGNLLLFLDADTVLPKYFLEKGLAELKNRELKIAAFLMKPCKKNRLFYLLLNLFYNWPSLFLEKILAHAAMAIFIEKELFKKVNGFDETIKIAEDHDLARRAKKVAKFGILRSVKVFISDRRFKQDGWLRTYFKYFFCELYMIFFGPIRKEIFDYKFNHYSKNKKKKI